MAMLAMRRILFICTGNIYRSRFAEALFNHHAGRAGLEWEASSRGLQIDLASGILAPQTRDALLERGISLHHTARESTALEESDLTGAALVVALNREEHQPMMKQCFPRWADRVDYWDIRDVEFESPKRALPRIEGHVFRLVEILTEGHALIGPGATTSTEF